MSSLDQGTQFSDAEANWENTENNAAVYRLSQNPEEIAAKYRPYLKTLAEVEFPEALKTRVDDSDLVQESLMKACRDLSGFRGTTEAELKTWLVQIMRNQLTDMVRFHGRQQRDILEESRTGLSGVCSRVESPSDRLKKNETYEWFWRHVETLPEDYRTVILLRQQQDLSFVEIATQMQRSPDAARMLWGRAIVALGELLEEAGVSVDL